MAGFEFLMPGGEKEVGLGEGSDPRKKKNPESSERLAKDGAVKPHRS
jgi:hypothetical protein